MCTVSHYTVKLGISPWSWRTNQGFENTFVQVTLFPVCIILELVSEVFGESMLVILFLRKYVGEFVTKKVVRNLFLEWVKRGGS